MESKNPAVRLVVFSKMKKVINSYKYHELNEADRKVIRGLFINRLKDFDEEHREMMKGRTLLERLKEGDTEIEPGKFLDDIPIKRKSTLFQNNSIKMFRHSIIDENI